MTKQTTPKQAPAKSLPPEEKKLLLPPPARHLWIFICLAVLALAFVASYAIHPWFVMSAGAVRAITTVVMAVFLLGLIFLFITMIKLFVDMWRSNMAAAERDKHLVTIALVLLLSIVIFSSTIYFFLL
jgi:hypothetical protein